MPVKLQPRENLHCTRCHVNIRKGITLIVNCINHTKNSNKFQMLKLPIKPEWDIWEMLQNLIFTRAWLFKKTPNKQKPKQKFKKKKNRQREGCVSCISHFSSRKIRVQICMTNWSWLLPLISDIWTQYNIRIEILRRDNYLHLTFSSILWRKNMNIEL